MTARPTRRWLPLLVLPIVLGVIVACTAPLPTTEQEVTANTKVTPVPSVQEQETVLDEVEVVEGRLILDKVQLYKSTGAANSAGAVAYVVADSLYEVELDASHVSASKQPLLLKEVQGRPLQ